MTTNLYKKHWCPIPPDLEINANYKNFRDVDIQNWLVHKSYSYIYLPIFTADIQKNLGQKKKEERFFCSKCKEWFFYHFTNSYVINHVNLHHASDDKLKLPDENFIMKWIK